jgi:hypothetical protein
MGIEPTSEAWEASILPLYDARRLLLILIILGNGFCAQRVCDNSVLAAGRCGSRIGYVKVSHLESPDRRSPVRLEKTAHLPRCSGRGPAARSPAPCTENDFQAFYDSLHFRWLDRGFHDYAASVTLGRKDY